MSLKATEPRKLQFGAHTFGEVPDRGETHTRSARVIREVVQHAVIADQVGLDFFGVGEHHRPDFAVSQPELLLASAAAQTTRIRLGSAVTVLSVHDPVFVYERFATLHALSAGRAELTVGPGSFRDVFELVGGNFAGRTEIYRRRLSELLALMPDTKAGSESDVAFGRGKLTPAVEGQLRIRAATSGSEASFLLAAEQGLPVVLAIRDGDPARFTSPAAHYIQAFRRSSQGEAEISLHMSGYIDETLDLARKSAWPFFLRVMSTLGAERQWTAPTRSSFDEMTSAGGPMLIGPPELIAEKIGLAMKQLGATRFAFKYGIGAMPNEMLTANIHRFATTVVPRVRAMLE